MNIIRSVLSTLVAEVHKITDNLTQFKIEFVLPIMKYENLIKMDYNIPQRQLHLMRIPANYDYEKTCLYDIQKAQHRVKLTLNV